MERIKQYCKEHKICTTCKLKDKTSTGCLETFKTMPEIWKKLK
jgi:hypothetical protein